MQSERGHLGAALVTIDRAVALDPLSRDALFSRGLLLDLTGRFDEAEAALRKAIEVEPQAATTHSQLAITKIHQGDTAAAVAVAGEETDPFWRRWALAMALSAHGDRQQADAELDALIGENGADSPFQIGELYAARKNPDEAFRWLDRALAIKDPGVNQLFTSSLLAAYRDDPRYAAIARKAGLDPANAPALPEGKAAAK
nr:tetratricopeptide repeat protein [Nevskia ramosa]